MQVTGRNQVLHNIAKNSKKKNLHFVQVQHLLDLGYEIRFLLENFTLYTAHKTKTKVLFNNSKKWNKKILLFLLKKSTFYDFRWVDGKIFSARGKKRCFFFIPTKTFCHSHVTLEDIFHHNIHIDFCERSFVRGIVHHTPLKVKSKFAKEVWVSFLFCLEKLGG